MYMKRPTNLVLSFSYGFFPSKRKTATASLWAGMGRIFQMRSHVASPVFYRAVPSSVQFIPLTLYLWPTHRCLCKCRQCRQWRWSSLSNSWSHHYSRLGFACNDPRQFSFKIPKFVCYCQDCHLQHPLCCGLTFWEAGSASSDMPCAAAACKRVPYSIILWMSLVLSVHGENAIGISWRHPRRAWHLRVFCPFHQRHQGDLRPHLHRHRGIAPYSSATSPWCLVWFRATKKLTWRENLGLGAKQEDSWQADDCVATSARS